MGKGITVHGDGVIMGDESHTSQIAIAAVAASVRGSFLSAFDDMLYMWLPAAHSEGAYTSAGAGADGSGRRLSYKDKWQVHAIIPCGPGIGDMRRTILPLTYEFLA